MNTKRKVPSVNLRQRKLPSGKIQLYLDITIDGHRTRESLNMFLEDSKSRVAKEKNRETLSIANEIAEKRRRDEAYASNGIQASNDGFMTMFFKYFETCINKHKDSTRKCWESTLVHLKRFEKNNNITLVRINKNWVESFRDYLFNDANSFYYNRRDQKTEDSGKKLNETSANAYYRRLVTALNWAVRDGLIQNNPAKMVQVDYRMKESEREYLTKDELQKLLSTPMPRPKRIRQQNYSIAPRAIIFSIMTGIRISDVTSINWSMVSVSEEGRYRITFNQKKTGRVMYLDINKKASEQLGERTEDNKPIFGVTNVVLNNYLKKWIEASGINKHITFHCCRHTFATLALQAGADLYTTSKLLGHTNVKTTQIYAKIVDQQKQKAVDLLNDFI